MAAERGAAKREALLMNSPRRKRSVSKLSPQKTNTGKCFDERGEVSSQKTNTVCFDERGEVSSQKTNTVCFGEGGGVSSAINVSDCVTAFTPSCPVCGVVLIKCTEMECNEHVVRCLSSSEINSRPSTSRVVGEEILCPCCLKVSLSPTELECHMQTCGVEVLSSVPPSRSSRSSRPSMSVSDMSLPSCTVPSSLAGMTGKRKKQTCITIKALSKMDESTQIALALSASMQPPVDVAISRRAAAKSSKTKIKFTAPPPMLIERDPKDSAKIVADRVAVLVGRSRVSRSVSSVQPVQPVLPTSKLHTGHDREEDGSERDVVRTEMLWDLSEKLLSKEVGAFYVASLVPPISPCKENADAHFRSLSQIPGFRLQLDATQKGPCPPRSIEKFEEIPTSSESRSDPLCHVDVVKKEEFPCSLPSVDEKHPTSHEAFTTRSGDCHTDVPVSVSQQPKKTDDAFESEDENEDARTLILFSSSSEDESK